MRILYTASIVVLIISLTSLTGVSMAKKLSSRELAAKKAGGTLNYKTGALIKPQLKVATKPKSVAPLVGAGPLLPGQVRVSSQGPAIGPLLENQSRPTPQKSTSSNRSQAKKAFDYSTAKSTPNSGLTGAGNTTFGGGAKTNINAALSSGGLVRGGGAKSLPGGGKPGIFERLFSTISEGQAGMAKGRSMAADEGAYNTPEQLAENRQQMQSTINSGIGVSNALANDIGGIQDDSQPFDYSQAKSQMADFSPENEGYAPYSQPGDTEQATALDNVFIRGEKPYDPFAGTQSRGDNRNDPFFGTQRRGDNSNDPFSGTQSRGDSSNDPFTPPTQEEVSQQANEQFGGGPGPVDTGGATIGNRSGRGSGAFGTGKGIQSDDPYIKELRKAYASNGGEKWLRKQFDELIAALDPTYAQMQKEGTDALNSQLNEQNTKLASVMNAGNVGDSEQRAQLMAGQQRDTQTALGNLLAKLAQNKAGDVSQYKTQYAQQRGQLADRNQSNQQKLMEQIQQYRNQQATGAGRVPAAPTMNNSKLSRNDVFSWTEDALNKGYSWQEIVDNAKEQGIGTETGGYLDQLLNQANKQNRYR